jgi:hypothetical protein
MWCWRRMDTISWTESVRNEAPNVRVSVATAKSEGKFMDGETS